MNCFDGARRGGRLCPPAEELSETRNPSANSLVPKGGKPRPPLRIFLEISRLCVGADAHIGPLESSKFVEDYHKIGPSCRGDVGIAPLRNGCLCAVQIAPDALFVRRGNRLPTEVFVRREKRKTTSQAGRRGA